MSKLTTIKITEEILDKYTSGSTAITGFYNTGVEVKSCTVPHHLTGFPQLAIVMLGLAARVKSGIDVRTIYSAVNKFRLVTIKGNSDNNDIFSVFRKYGIITGNLNIGIAGTPTNPIIYTTSKMCRDVSKYPEDVQAALALMLYSIAKVCVKTVYGNPSIVYNAVCNTVDTKIGLPDILTDISTINTITIAELPAEGYNQIDYIHNIFCPAYSTYRSTFTYGVICVLEDDGSYNFKESVILSAIAFGTNIYPIVITSRGVVYTTMELSSFESERDSYISAIAATYNIADVKIIKCDLNELIAQLPKKGSFIDIIDDADLEAQFLGESAAILADWVINTVGRRESLDAKITTQLVKMLGLTSSKSIASFDKDTIMEAYKDDEYAQQLYKQIKPYYEDFDLGTIEANCRGFAKGDLYSMMFIGGSGTGKSTSARVLPSRCGIPYTSINFSVNIEESDIVGSMIPNVTKSKPEDPEFVWQDGVLTKAVRNGYCIILEEINFARPGVLGKLNSLLDENRQLDLPTGEIVIAHPNFRIIATCNVAYEGTNRFNKALINRFEDCTVFSDVTRSKAIDIIQKRTGYKNMAKIDPILNVYEAIKKYSREQNLNLVISMRQLLNIFSNGKYYKDALDAVTRIMINGAFIEEPEYQEEFVKAVLPAFKLSYKI